MNHKQCKELLEKGIVSKEVFEALHASANEEEASRLSIDQTWEFLKKLNLATEMKSDETLCLYVPSLIPERNEKEIKRALDQIRQSTNSLGFYASFRKSDSVADLYSKLLCRLASKEFFFKEKNPGIRFDLSFAAKIENRSLGMVAGTKGSLTWEGGKGSKKSTVNFVTVEIDCDNASKEMKFARHKVSQMFSKQLYIDILSGHLHLSSGKGAYRGF